MLGKFNSAVMMAATMKQVSGIAAARGKPSSSGGAGFVNYSADRSPNRKMIAKVIIYLTKQNRCERITQSKKTGSPERILRRTQATT